MFSDESQDRFDAIYRAIPGSRVHVLEFQELLLECLGNASKLILNCATGGANQLRRIATDRSYLFFVEPDFEKILGLVHARLNAARDHVWGLREDPGYFASMVEQNCAHSTQFNAKGDMKCICCEESVKIRSFWTEGVVRMFRTAHQDVSLWRHVQH